MKLSKPLCHIAVGGLNICVIGHCCKNWEEDLQFRHEAAIKPRLTDADYHADYLSEKIGVEKRLKWTAEKFFVTTEEEPLFDAADVLRFGKDLVVQHGFTTNLKGIEWIRRF